MNRLFGVFITFIGFLGLQWVAPSHAFECANCTVEFMQDSGVRGLLGSQDPSSLILNPIFNPIKPLKGEGCDIPGNTTYAEVPKVLNKNETLLNVFVEASWMSVQSGGMIVATGKDPSKSSLILFRSANTGKVIAIDLKGKRTELNLLTLKPFILKYGDLKWAWLNQSATECLRVDIAKQEETRRKLEAEKRKKAEKEWNLVQFVISKVKPYEPTTTYGFGDKVLSSRGSSNSIDCSGLTAWIMRNILEREIPDGAMNQARAGAPTGKVADIKPLSLIAFVDENGRRSINGSAKLAPGEFGHVGVVLQVDKSQKGKVRLKIVDANSTQNGIAFRWIEVTQDQIVQPGAEIGWDAKQLRLKRGRKYAFIPYQNLPKRMSVPKKKT